MTVSTDSIMSEIHVSVEWAARLENLTQHHVRRLARQGCYEGAFKRGGYGHWLIPLASVTRTLDGTIRHHMDTTPVPE